MAKRTLLKKVGIGLSALCLMTAIGVAGCATQEQLDAAVKKAEDAAARAEAAAAKCEKAFEQGLRK
jgi:hypothetical protein